MTSKYDKYKESAFTHEVMQPLVIDGDDLTVAYMAGYADAKDKYVTEIKRLRFLMWEVDCMISEGDADHAQSLIREELGEKE